MAFMKNFIKIAAVIIFPVFLGACSSSAELKAPYSKVAEAVKERFKRSEWTQNATRKSVVKEEPGDLYIKYYEWQFPDTKIICQIEVEQEGPDLTEVYVFVRDHDSWFSPFIHNYTDAREVIELLKTRLKTGRWGKLPWVPKKNAFYD
jgi:hypothetical protein